MDKLTRKWLQPFSWESLLDYLTRFWNRDARECRGPGYEPAQLLWEDATPQMMTLQQALGVCRQCQTLRPFGMREAESFAMIGRLLVQPLTKTMAPTLAATVAAVVEDYIAGSSDDQELGQILRLIEARSPELGDYKPPSSLFA